MVGTGANATTQCPLSSDQICLFSGANYTGTSWKWFAGMSFAAPYYKWLPACCRDTASSATNSDPGNRWAIWDDRGGLLNDTLLYKLPQGTSISNFSAGTTDRADYIGCY